MENDWMMFFELVERLHPISPDLVQLALRYGQSRDQAVLAEVERELEVQSGGAARPEPFVDPSQPTSKVKLRRCQEFLAQLRQQEEELRETQVRTALDLSQVQAARKAFEATLKEWLRSEHRDHPASEWAGLLASDEEVAAGLQNLQEHGGLELHQFIGELEQVLQNRDCTGK